MITDYFLKFYAQHNSAILRFITGGAVGLVTLLISKLGLNLSEETSIQLAAAVTAVVNWIISETVANIQAKRAKEVQEVINNVTTKIIPSVKEDGQIGDQTLGAVNKMADLINNVAPEELKKANQ